MAIRELLLKREQARAGHDFARADCLRDELRAAGVRVDDRAGTWACVDGRAGKHRVDGTTSPAPASTAALPHARPRHLRNLRPRHARLIHGHEHLARRWRELGFVIAGGGMRQALLLIRELLADPGDSTQIAVLSINRSAAEVPCFQELRDLATLYPSRVRVAFSLTSATVKHGEWTGFIGRGGVAMGQAALPSPSCGEGAHGNVANTGVMVIVSGRVQGEPAGDSFIELWGGVMGTKPATKGTSKMQRVQGRLGGILKEIGFSSDQVFQI